MALIMAKKHSFILSNVSKQLYNNDHSAICLTVATQQTFFTS